MNISMRTRQVLMAFVLVCVLTFTAACSSVSARSPEVNNSASIDRSLEYGQLARGNSAMGQEFGDWVVKTSKGLVKDAFVRDNDKLGVVISSQVRPNEVKALAQSLAQGFHKKLPNQDLNVLLYAPNKDLILTTHYNTRTNQIEYQPAS